VFGLLRLQEEDLDNLEAMDMEALGPDPVAAVLQENTITLHQKAPVMGLVWAKSLAMESATRPA
jgi:hypothetical protein